MNLQEQLAELASDPVEEAEADERIDRHPKGTIALPVGGTPRYHQFMMSLLALRVPPGTYYSMMRSMDVTAALNDIIREMTGEWVWFQADDHLFAPDTLLRLLDHEADVVVPLMCKKSPPFSLVVYDEETTHEGPDGRMYPAYREISFDNLPVSGLLDVHAAGSGSMLVRKHVLDAIGDPWFESSHGTVTNDDLEFCRKIRHAGYRILLDVGTAVGHLGNFTAFPMCNGGRWGLTFDFGGPGTNRIWLTKEAVQAMEASHDGNPT